MYHFPSDLMFSEVRNNRINNRGNVKSSDSSIGIRKEEDRKVEIQR